MDGANSQWHQHNRAATAMYAAFLDFIAQTGHADGEGDWQEDTCEMIKRLKDQYFAELSDLYSHVSRNLDVVDNIIPHKEPSEQYDWMRNFKIMLEHILRFLQMNKNSIQLEPTLRDEVSQYEKRIIKMRMLKVYVPQRPLLTQQLHQVQKLQQRSVQPHLIQSAQMQPNNPQQHHLMMQSTQMQPNIQPQQQRPLTQSTQMQANIQQEQFLMQLLRQANFQQQQSMMSSTEIARIQACRESQMFQWQLSQMRSTQTQRNILQQQSLMQQNILQQQSLMQSTQSSMQPNIQQQQSSMQPTQMQYSQQPMMLMSSHRQTEQSTVLEAEKMIMLEKLFKEL